MKFRIDLKILLFISLFFFTGQIKLYLIVMAFALLHELAHLIVGMSLGFKPTELELMPFGFWISLRPKVEDYKVHIIKSNLTELKYIFVALAGPILNLLLVIFFANTDLVSETSEMALIGRNSFAITKQVLKYSNLWLFLLNLVPIYPLDGGRILRSMFRIFIEKRKADEIINVIANIIIVLITITGSIAILYFKNIAIVLILSYLWILVIRENKRYRLRKKVMEHK